MGGTGAASFTTSPRFWLDEERRERPAGAAAGGRHGVGGGNALIPVPSMCSAQRPSQQLVSNFLPRTNPKDRRYARGGGGKRFFRAVVWKAVARTVLAMTLCPKAGRADATCRSREERAIDAIVDAGDAGCWAVNWVGRALRG